jgi:carbamate kinase
MKTEAKKEILLVALGGNALIRKGQVGTVEEQFQNLKVPIQQIARMELGIHTGQRLVSLISYVVVDENDPAFQDPSKPIGPIFTPERARHLPYPTRKTAKGYRRVVASPKPLTIVEKREIQKLIAEDFIVICCGGGGIPVIREGRAFQGVDAVIDKDLASAKLAEEVGVDIFLIATDVEGAASQFGEPDQEFLRTLTTEQANLYLKQGHFPPGSMGPKVEAAVQFIKSGGKRAIIASILSIEEAVVGNAGTEVTR